MDKSQQILSTIRDQGLVPLFYHDDVQKCISITRALYKGGIRLLEFTNRGPAALANFRQLRTVITDELPGMYLGIGTIKNEKDAEQFIEAKADFIVCPIVHPSIAQVCSRHNTLWIPGCLTATEIALAETLGAGLVKIFPGSLVGPSYISAIKDIFPGIMFMPTGGVDMTKESVGAWFKAGVVAVGMGSKLITKQVLEQTDYTTLSTASTGALAIVHSVKK